jgi:MFS family permease
VTELSQRREPETPETLDQAYGRDFKLYITAKAVSVVGDRVSIITLTFLVIKLSHSFAPALSLFYISRLLPTLVGGLIAGVMVDRYDRRRCMVVCDLGRGVLMASVPVLGSLTLWTLYPLVLVLYGFTVLFDTAAQAALPDVVPETRVMGANAIMQGIETTGDFAYVLGGTLIYVLGLQAPFYLDAATFLVSASCVFAMRIPSRRDGDVSRHEDVSALIRDGISHLLGNPFLKWSTVALAMGPIAGGAAFVLMPLFADHALGHGIAASGPIHNGAFRYSLLQVGEAVGAIVGALLVGPLARRIPRGTLFGVGVTGVGFAFILLGFTANLYFSMAALFAAGLFNSLFIVSGITLAQTLTPSEMRGRVLAARYTVVNAFLAIGAALGGALLLVFSYSALWFIAGSIVVLSSLFIWLPPEVRGQR